MLFDVVGGCGAPPRLGNCASALSHGAVVSACNRLPIAHARHSRNNGADGADRIAGRLRIALLDWYRRPAMQPTVRSGTRVTWVVSAALALAAAAPAARAQDAERAYFSGKTVRMVVGYGPGGGYDASATWTRPRPARTRRMWSPISARSRENGCRIFSPRPAEPGIEVTLR
jgi:hypothetical protein